MATGFIDLDDTADPDIETLADTPCDLCGAPLDCGEYVTLLVWCHHPVTGKGPPAPMYLHPACAETLRDNVERSYNLEAR